MSGTENEGELTDDESSSLLVEDSIASIKINKHLGRGLCISSCVLVKLLKFKQESVRSV